MASAQTPITQAEFTALAALANSKVNLVGRPYSFDAPSNPFDSSPATIWTELARLRSNLGIQFQLFNQRPGFGEGWGYAGQWPFHPSSLISETFTYLNFGGSNFNQLQTFDLDVAGGANPDEIQIPAVDRCFGQVPTWKNPRYVSTRTTGAINTRMVLSEFMGAPALFSPLYADPSAVGNSTPTQLLFASRSVHTGTPGTFYNVAFAISGVVEANAITGGASDGKFFYSSGTPAANYNIYSLIITSPSGVRRRYYLNGFWSGYGNNGYPNAIVYNVTLSVEGGSTIELEANSQDMNELKNGAGNGGSLFPPHSIPGDPGLLPNLGQYMRVAWTNPVPTAYREFFHDFPPETFYQWNDAAKNPSVPFKFKLAFDGKNFTTTFRVDWLARSRTTSAADTLALFGANAADCVLTKTYDGIVSGRAQWHGSITCAKVYSADMTFEVGLRDTTEGTTRALESIAKAAIAETQSPLKKQICYFERSDAATVPFPVLDGFSDGAMITAPNLAALKALPWQVDAQDVWISGADHEYPNTLFTGNQAKITITPANAADDFKTSGVWLVQSFALGSKYFYQAYLNAANVVRGLNPGAYRPTRGFDVATPGFPKKSPHANDVVTPTYDTAQSTLPTPQDYTWSIIDGDGHKISGGYYLQGGVITSITVARAPVPMASNPAIKVFPTDRPALTVRLGRSFTNAVHWRELLTVTIPAGEVSVTVATFLITQAVYPERADKYTLVAVADLPVVVTPVYQAPMTNTTGHALTPTPAAAFPYFNNFLNQSVENTQPALIPGCLNDTGLKLAAHFNDTAALLGLAT